MNAFAQSSLVPANLPHNYQSHQTNRSGNPDQDVQMVNCTDTVYYIERNYINNNANYGFYEVGGNAGAANFYQVYPSFTGQVTAAWIYAGYYTAGSVATKISVYALNGAGAPTGSPLAFINVNVNAGGAEFGGTLNTPANVTNGFAIGVQVTATSGNDSIGLLYFEDMWDTQYLSYINDGSSISSIQQYAGFDIDWACYPLIQFTAPTPVVTANPTSGCPGTPINFSSTSSTGMPSHYSSSNAVDVYNVNSTSPYSWNFGDATTASSQGFATHTYSANGSFNVTYSETYTGWSKNCTTSPGTTPVSMNGVVPSVSIMVSSTVVCPSDNIMFQANSTGGGSNPSYVWKKNGFTVSTSSMYGGSGFAGGDQIVCEMTSSDPCASPTLATSNMITMQAQPGSISAFTYTGTALVYQFTSQSLNAVSFLWDFGDAGSSTAPAPSHTYAANGIYTVQLTTTNQCGATNVSFLNVSVTGGTTSGGNVGMTEQALTIDAQAFPNPAGDALNLVYTLDYASDMTIEVMNNLGQVVSTQVVNNASSGTLQLPMEQYAAGMYFIRLAAGNEQTVIRVAHQ